MPDKKQVGVGLEPRDRLNSSPIETVVYTDPETGTRYKVLYRGGGAPGEQQIRDSLGLKARAVRLEQTNDAPGVAVHHPPPVEVRSPRTNAPRPKSFLDTLAGMFAGAGRGGYDAVENNPVTQAAVPPPDPLGLALSPPAIEATPVYRDVARTVATLGSSVRNFTQGALAPGLDRYDASQAGQVPSTSVLQNAGNMVAPIFSDIGGNAAAGIDALRGNDGDKRIGARVPSLSPDTLGGTAYNLLTAAGSDPLNFIGGIGHYDDPVKLAALFGKRGAVPPPDVSPGVAGRGAAPPVDPARSAPATFTRSFGTNKLPGERSPVRSPYEIEPEEGFAPFIPAPKNPAALGGKSVGAGPVSPVPFPRAKVRFDGGVDDLPAFGVASRMFDEAAGLRSPSAAPVAGAVASPPFRKANVFQKTGKTARNTFSVAADRSLAGYDAVNDSMRALSYGGDLSAPLRQGLVLGVTRPVAASRAFAAQIKAAVSEKGFTEGLRQIASRPNAPLYQKTGLYLPDVEAVNAGNVLRREEAFASALVEKIPGVGHIVKASDRAMTGYLSRLRADVFDGTAVGWQKAGITPETHPEEYAALASWINTTTGRGDLGKLEAIAPVLSRVFGAPRYQASRLQTLMAPANYMKLPPAARRLVMRDYAAFVGANLALVSTAAVYAKANPDSGLRVSSDPTASDFGDIVIGETRLDMLGAGISPWARFFLQMGSGQKNGKAKDRGEIATTFLRGRAAPAINLPLDYALGSDITGQETRNGAKPDPVLLRRFWSLAQADAYDAVKQHGPLLGGALGGLAMGGAGVSDWSDEETGRAKLAREHHDLDSEQDNQTAALESESYWRAQARKQRKRKEAAKTPTWGLKKELNDEE